LGRFAPLANNWKSPSAAPTARASHMEVWTGTELLVWGGWDGTMLNTGGRFDPVANVWKPVSQTGALNARAFTTAVWTGSEMIIWGGKLADVTGGRYNPVTDSWTAMTTNGVPTARISHTGVWTGSELIVWGGSDGGADKLNSGGRYNPLTDTWKSTALSGAPPPRADHTAVWTGTEMLVWGGTDKSGIFTVYRNNGGRYDPVSDNWMSMNSVGGPSNRVSQTGIWSGSEMIIWGGYGGAAGTNYLGDGARYRPDADRWMGMTTDNAPSGRTGHVAVWTGREMIVWGGTKPGGAAYEPVNDVWTTLSSSDSPPLRYDHSAIWTGQEMIVWGGLSLGDGLNFMNDTWSYRPRRIKQLYLRP